MKCKIMICVLILVVISVSSGCLQHGFEEGQRVKTTLEYNQRTNTSYAGEIVLIENTRSITAPRYESDHYIITVQNKTLGSKWKFDEMDLIQE